MRKAGRSRIAWEDRFTTPTVGELLRDFGKQQTQLVEQARAGVMAIEGTSESLSWLGIPWRWTFEYRIEGSDERPWVYLVPQPGRPLLAIPMAAEMVQALPLRRLPKFIRDAAANSPRVAGVCWMQWELTGRGMVDELLGLARRKRETALSAAK